MLFLKRIFLLSTIILSLLFSSCVNGKKMDRFVGKQYNNTLPVSRFKESPSITVHSSVPGGTEKLSSTTTKTSNMLPLLFYWKWQYTNTCSLNPAIAEETVTRAIQAKNRSFSNKLGDRKLEIDIQEVPSGFALVDKAHLVWVVYAFGWDKIYIEPQSSPLKIGYRVLNADGSLLSEGTSVQECRLQRDGLGFFESWKNATSTFLANYNSELTRMTRSALQDIENAL